MLNTSELTHLPKKKTPIVEVRGSHETWEIEDPTSEEVVYWPVAWRHWREDSSRENHEIWETDDLNDHEVVYRPTAWPRQRGGSSSVDSPSSTSPVPYHSKNPKKLENPKNPKKLENPKNPKKL